MPDYNIMKNEDTGLLVAQERGPVIQNIDPAKMELPEINDVIYEARKKINQRPYVYFWIVEFNDNTAIAQFDPKTGNENSYGEEVIPRANKIVAVRWVPFSENLVGIVSVPCIALPITLHRVEVDQGQVVVLFRRNRLHYSGGLARGRTEYFLGIQGRPVKQIFENGKFQISTDYKGYE